MEIAAGGCTLVVTDSHRVMVARGKQVQHKRAGALHKGDRVLCNGNQPMLVDVRAVSQPVVFSVAGASRCWLTCVLFRAG